MSITLEGLVEKQVVLTKVHLLLVFGELPVTFESGLDIAVSVEEVQHQLQGVSVHVHVQPVLWIGQVGQRSKIINLSKMKDLSTCDKTKRIVEVQRARLGLLGASFSSVKNLLTSP